MKFFLKQIFLLFLFLTFAPAVFSQQKEDVFKAGPDFAKQVENFIDAKTPENKEDVKKFTDKLQSGVIQGSNLEDVIALMNLYVRKRANPVPHLLNLVKTVDAFWSRNRSAEYKNWHVYMSKLMNKTNVPVSRMNEVIVFTFNLLTYNSIETIGNKNWYMSSSGYKIEYSTDGDGDEYISVSSSKTDLRCRERNDSTLVIYSTSGVYNSKNHVWTGKGGRVDWRRGGLSADSIYADLESYVIDTKGDHYKADNVTFYNKKYFSVSVKGALEDKVVLAGTGVKARYPQFKSSVYDLEIRNIVKGVDYFGGCSQTGAIFAGYSPNDSLQSSHLIFWNKNKKFIDAAMQSVVFGDDKFECKNAKVEIAVGDTVMTHPDIKIKYNTATEQLVLFKGVSVVEIAKYNDYYHNLSIDVDQLEWQLDDTVLYFATRLASALDYAVFQSDEYFSLSDYNDMQGVSAVHPLVVVERYYYEDLNGHIENFSMKGLQKFIYANFGAVLSETQVNQMLLKLSYEEFISYDASAKKILKVGQKLHDWIGMSRGKRDYNNISIISDATGRNTINAELNLNSNELTIYNVKPFDLSQRRKVRVSPDSAITIYKDMFTKFRGKIQAGLVDFYGKDFEFDYGKFNINIVKADSMALFSIGKTEDGLRRTIDSVRSVLENIAGVLNIDRANNKSGYNRNVTTADNFYPVLTTKDTSYVYYDRLVSDKYVRDIFHVAVYPFTLDSLSSMKLSGLSLKSDFVSNIFPLLHVNLIAQPDFSLGFRIPTPKEGMELYSGKGRFYSDITLNANGLNGDGEIRYLTSVSRSRQFFFFPDSVHGGCYYVDIKGVKPSEIGQVAGITAEYPGVYSDTAQVYWMPKGDIFSTVTADTTLKLYDKSVAFNGKVDYTPSKMMAQGEMLLYNDGLFSDHYLLKNTSFDADSAVLCNFDDKNPGDSTGHFYTGRYDARYDLAAKYAQFVTSGKTSEVYFPQHKYKQRTDFFRYDLAKGFFEFGKDLRNYDAKMIVNTENELEDLRASTGKNPKYKPLLSGVTMTAYKDTLTFPAQSSSYENSNGIIEVNEPGIIRVVDTKIDPSGIIKINRGGDIDKFSNALITANFDSLYHKIINTTVKIRDKYYFKAKGGQYEYVNESKETSFLNLDSMEVRKMKLDTAASAPVLRVSFGIGSVQTDENFMLSPQYAFSGKYSFIGLNKGIKFNGFAYIRQNCDTAVMPFKFEGTLDPDHIIFPISERVMDTAKVRLYTGFFYNETSGRLYSVFMGHKTEPEDYPVLDANRGLDYLVSKNLYEVAPIRRLRDSSAYDNYVAYKQNTCSIYAEGTVNPNINIEPLQVVSKGSIDDDRDLRTITLSTLTTVNLVIKQDLVKMMAEDISLSENVQPVNLTDIAIQRRLGMLCGRDTLEKIMKDYTMTGEISKMPASLSKTFVFSNLDMKFDTVSHSYRSLGKIGVAFIGEKAVNRFVNGNIEIIANKKKGDQITIYLEPENGKWYYFNYSMGMLYCLSSQSEFNDKIINTKEKDRSFKLKGVDYQYLVAADDARSKFLRSLKNQIVESETPVLNDFEKNIESENEGGDTDIKKPIPQSEEQGAKPQPAEDDEQDFIDE